MDINNLTQEQKEFIAQLSCTEEIGCYGANTYPQCNRCMVCICRKETKYNQHLQEFEE